MKNIEQPIIALVIPCYNEGLALPKTMPIILRILNNLKQNKLISINSFILCVNDGSKDNTWQIIKELHIKNNDVKGITLAHNRGHQYALYAGLMHVKDKCDAAISMDADLQDDPNVIEEMIKLFIMGSEIVYGVRSSRDTDTWFKRNSARAFYKLQRTMGLQTIFDHADFRLMSSRAIDILSQYKEHNLFLRGIIPQIGLSTAVVKYARNERVAGDSKYPLKKMIAFSIDGITSFTAKPIRYIFNIGLILMLLDIIISIYVLIAHYAGNTVSGWTSLMLSLWFLGSLLLISLGIIGEYIGKIFVEVKNRPRYNIDEVIE